MNRSDHHTGSAGPGPSPEEAPRSSLAESAEALGLFADPTRVRLLCLLERGERTVADLTQVTDLAQSTVSTHLAKLRDAGLVHDRRAGTSRFYALREGAVPLATAALWRAIRGQLDDGLLETDARRLEALLEARAADEPWAEGVAGEMDRHYSPGRTWEALARAVLPLVRLGDVLDVGCGDGTTAAMLAPRARSYVGLDRGPRVIGAAAHRALPNASFVRADMHALPFPAGAFDEVLLLHVLAYAGEPERALSEAARVLRPGGMLVLVTLAEHGHADVTRGYGHVNEGLSPGALRRAIGEAGLLALECDVTSRERRPPYFEVVTAVAKKACEVRA